MQVSNNVVRVNNDRTFSYGWTTSLKTTPPCQCAIYLHPSLSSPCLFAQEKKNIHVKRNHPSTSEAWPCLFTFNWRDWKTQEITLHKVHALSLFFKVVCNLLWNLYICTTPVAMGSEHKWCITNAFDLKLISKAHKKRSVCQGK